MPLSEEYLQKVKEQPLNFQTFDPTIIPYQYDVIYDIKNHFNYDNGPHYCLLSGSIGSAKSVLMAWLSIRHVTEFNGARVLLGRKAMVDLKDTIFQEILDMLDGVPSLVEGEHYKVNYSRATIKFANGSEIISRSWHDKKYKKFRSLKLSMIVIEELTENDSKDWAFFNECIGRLGRAKDKNNKTITENIFIAATNPDDPSHPAYEFFIKGSKRTKNYACKEDEDGNKNIHTYYSLTSDNPFLPDWYHASLRKKYDPKVIRRMLYGEWLYISTDVIYSCYDPEKHLVDEIKIRKSLPITISFDFNIAKGKPMSSCAYQFNKRAKNVVGDRRFNFIEEVAVEGARTNDAMDEWAGKGIFDLPHNPKIIIHGDVSGKHGSSKSNDTDYELIEKFLSNYVREDGDSLDFDIELPSTNPSLRNSHNIVNGQLENADGEIAIAVARKCEFVEKGFANTRLKENAGLVEDQTTEGQDMSSAFRYGIWYDIEYNLEDDEDEIIFS